MNKTHLSAHACRAVTPLLFLFLLVLLTPLSAMAQQAGVSIKPATIEESLDPGAVRSYDIQIQNLVQADQEYFLSVRNISGVRDGGVPVFANSNTELTGYELADWVSLPVESVFLPAGNATTVSIQIAVPENASPGSHFGGIFISVEPPEIERSGAAVGYQVANIIDIRVAGDIVEQGSIRQFSTSRFFYGSQDVTFNVRIENTGNVLIKPRGPLEIYNMLGAKVDTFMFNDNEGAVLPRFLDAEGNVVSDGTREFRNIQWTGGSVGFGRYEAILSPVYGEDGAIKTMSSTVSFWILPLNIILPALAVLALLLLITYIFVRLYIKRSLAHLTHGRRVVRRRKKGGSSAVLLFMVVMLTVTALFMIVLLAIFA